jgi:hypothetical protein
LLLAEPTHPLDFVEELTRAGGVRFLAHLCTGAKRSAEEEGKATTSSFDALCTETLRLIQEELDHQAASSPEDTSGVPSLLAGWAALDPDADCRAWMRSIIESGRWPFPDVLGLFVPTRTSSTGDGPSRPALGDTELGFLDQIVGLQYVVERLGTVPEPSAEPPFGNSDVSWEARVRRAERAVARWAASSKASHDLTPHPDNGNATSVNATPG